MHNNGESELKKYITKYEPKKSAHKSICNVYMKCVSNAYILWFSFHFFSLARFFFGMQIKTKYMDMDILNRPKPSIHIYASYKQLAVVIRGLGNTLLNRYNVQKHFWQRVANQCQQ